MLADVELVGQTIVFCRLSSGDRGRRQKSIVCCTVPSWKYKLQMRTTRKLSARPKTVSRSHLILLCTLAGALVLCAATFGQKAFREYPGWEYEMFPKPPDWQVPGEWVFARLMYPSVRFSDRPYTNWLYGAANWTI